MLIWDNFVVGWCECCWRDSCFSLFKDWFILWHKPYRCTYTDDMINAHRFATTYDKICYHTLQTQGNPSNCWWNVPWPRHHCFRISKGFGIHQNPKIFNQVNHEQEIQRGPPWVSFIRDVILPLIFGNNKGKNKIRSSVDSTSITRSGSMNQRENGGTVYPLFKGSFGGLNSWGTIPRVTPFSLWINPPIVSPTRIFLANVFRDVFEMLHGEFFVHCFLRLT